MWQDNARCQNDLRCLLRTPNPACRGRARSTAFRASGDRSILSTGAFAPCIYRGGVGRLRRSMLRAFLALDPSAPPDCGALTMPGWLYKADVDRWCHLGSFGIPGELFSAGRVVTVNDSDQLASGVEVIPFGGGRAKTINGCGLLALPTGGGAGNTPEQISSGVNTSIEVSLYG